jgi:DmsE family decaheme c-type cytochrome
VHADRPAAPHPRVSFQTKAACDAQADPVGAARCVACHPLRDALLVESAHASLSAGVTQTWCETCHGEGSLHAAANGVARLITRPDRARDTVATCRGCHPEVDATEFHWRGRRSPLLSKGMTCTSCHVVHRARAAPLGGSVDRDTGEDRHTGQDPAAKLTNRACQACHAPAFGAVHATAHDALKGLDAPLGMGCGACHPGSAAHARAGGKRELVESLHGTPATTQLAVCGSCHERDRALRHVANGSHHRADVSCLSCHDLTTPRGKTREQAASRCAACHQAVAARFRQPNRHPVAGLDERGVMLCTDCHEPHGARRKVRDLELRQDRCVTCHREYRGPFVFAHQASRSDGCVVCHEPHGSSNRRMLQQATTQQNCLQCHADFPAFHDQTAGSVFTNCLNCHTEVHGSNHSRFLFR